MGAGPRRIAGRYRINAAVLSERMSVITSMRCASTSIMSGIATKALGLVPNRPRKVLVHDAAPFIVRTRCRSFNHGGHGVLSSRRAEISAVKDP